MKDDIHEEMQNLYARLRMVEEFVDSKFMELDRDSDAHKSLVDTSWKIRDVADDLWELSKQYEKEVVVYRTKSEILDEVAGVMYYRMEEHTAIHGDSSLDITKWEEGSFGTGKSSPQKETGKVIQFDCTRKNNEEEK